MIEFTGFSKIPRYNREVVVSEKIDGTNAQIYITEDGQFFTGSKNRWITPENDNYGFSSWAHNHKDELIQLGPGRHFGEWWGQGIQRGYSLKEKRFSLFNISLWAIDRPPCCHVVPELWRGMIEDMDVKSIMDRLMSHGSYASVGFKNPEGVIIYHTSGNIFFKKTYKNDEKGKWENKKP
jgi:hypothetical protein